MGWVQKQDPQSLAQNYCHFLGQILVRKNSMQLLFAKFWTENNWGYLGQETAAIVSRKLAQVTAVILSQIPF